MVDRGRGSQELSPPEIEGKSDGGRDRVPTDFGLMTFIDVGGDDVCLSGFLTSHAGG